MISVKRCLLGLGTAAFVTAGGCGDSSPSPPTGGTRTASDAPAGGKPAGGRAGTPPPGKAPAPAPPPP